VRECSVVKKVQIVAGELNDYKQLACYHYRDSKIGPYAAVFAMRFGRETVGVIVYTMPSAGLELRNIATNGLLSGFDRKTNLSLINRNVRCVGRVIIEPRFRSLGLASRLVRETMPKMNVPIVEAMAVMGMVNPFFEKAGMTAYTAKMPARCVQLIEAFGIIGIEGKGLIDPPKVQQRFERLEKRQAEFIELQIKNFLQSYGRRRDMAGGLERTRFVLSKLTERPVYYIWFNEKIGFRV
jgi:hypothetical protein